MAARRCLAGTETTSTNSCQPGLEVCVRSSMTFARGKLDARDVEGDRQAFEISVVVVQLRYWLDNPEAPARHPMPCGCAH